MLILLRTVRGKRGGGGGGGGTKTRWEGVGRKAVGSTGRSCMGV